MWRRLANAFFSHRFSHCVPLRSRHQLDSSSRICSRFVLYTDRNFPRSNFLRLCVVPRGRTLQHPMLLPSFSLVLFLRILWVSCVRCSDTFNDKISPHRFSTEYLPTIVAFSGKFFVFKDVVDIAFIAEYSAFTCIRLLTVSRSGRWRRNC